MASTEDSKFSSIFFYEDEKCLQGGKGKAKEGKLTRREIIKQPKNAPIDKKKGVLSK